MALVEGLTEMQPVINVLGISISGILLVYILVLFIRIQQFILIKKAMKEIKTDLAYIKKKVNKRVKEKV